MRPTIDRLQTLSSPYPWKTTVPDRPRHREQVDNTSSFAEWERQHQRKERRQIGTLILVSALPIGLVCLVPDSLTRILVAVELLTVLLIGVATLLSANRLP